jgi:hypothetical protein
LVTYDERERERERERRNANIAQDRRRQTFLTSQKMTSKFLTQQQKEANGNKTRRAKLNKIKYTYYY